MEYGIPIKLLSNGLFLTINSLDILLSDSMQTLLSIIRDTIRIIDGV